MYSNTPTGGSETAYWEDEWADMDLSVAKDEMLASALLGVLHDHLKGRQGMVLEAGCGSGIVAAALESMGHQVIGVDLAVQALVRARGEWPEFRGTVGDVRKMPFADRTFDAVVSLGVLEHEEVGPEEALAEHRRVLQDGGLLLITVPRRSPLKSARDFWNLTLRREPGYISRGRWAETRSGVYSEQHDRPFHQYEFSRAHWSGLLRDSGFEILKSQSTAVGSGLGDLRVPSRRAVGADPGAVVPPSEASPSKSPGQPIAGQPIRSARKLLGRWKAAAMSEKATNGFEELLVKSTQYGLGHMNLTVAKRL